jgi:hypothetical protein
LLRWDHPFGQALAESTRAISRLLKLSQTEPIIQFRDQ